MQQQVDRRRILKASLGAAAGVCLPGFVGGPALAAATSRDSAASPALEVTRLSETLRLIQGTGGNVVAGRTPAGRGLMVDGGSPEYAEALLARVREALGVDEVATLFNTHWHPTRTGSNEVLGRDGARIVAHENTRLWLGRDIERPWEERVIERLPPEARPNDTYYDSAELDVDGRAVEIGYLLQAHTDGDIYVYFPEDNVLAAGGVVTADRWPLLDWWTGGWIGGVIDGFDALLEVADSDTQIVPGHGEVLARADLERQREMYETIFERLAELFFEARDPDEVVAARPTREFDEQFGDPELFVRLAYRSMGPHFSPEA